MISFAEAGRMLWGLYLYMESTEPLPSLKKEYKKKRLSILNARKTATDSEQMLLMQRWEQERIALLKQIEFEK